MSTYSGQYSSVRRINVRNSRWGKPQRKFRDKVMKSLGSLGLAKHTYFSNSQARFISTSSGQQINGTLQAQNSFADVSNIYTEVETITGQTSNCHRFDICNYRAEVQMKNQTNASVTCDIYKCRPRFDTTVFPHTAWHNGCNDIGASNMDLLWGSTPFSSPEFTATYKVLSKQRITLAPGATRIVTTNDNRTYQFNGEHFENAVTGTIFAKYATIWMMTVRGEPYNDITTKTLVNTTPCAVDVVAAETYMYQIVLESVQYASTATTLGTITGASSLLQPTGAQLATIVES